MTPVKQPSGFARLSPEARIANATRAGKLAHLKGTPHTFTSDEAKIAGSKGGRETKRRRLARQQGEGT